MSTYPPEFQALLDAGPRFDEQLGAVVRTSALLERQLSWLYGVLLQSPHGLLVAAGISFGQLLDLIDAPLKAEETTKVLEPRLVIDINELTQAVRHDVVQQRNSAVHGVWSLNAINPDERWTRRVQGRRPFRRSLKRGPSIRSRRLLVDSRLSGSNGSGWLPPGWTLERIKRAAAGDFWFADPTTHEVRDESGASVHADSILIHGEYALVHEADDTDQWSLGRYADGQVEVFAGYGSLDATIRGL